MLDCEDRPREWPGREVSEGAEEVVEAIDEVERVCPCRLAVAARILVLDGELGVDLLA